jgi:hypothetical protein
LVWEDQDKINKVHLYNVFNEPINYSILSEKEDFDDLDQLDEYKEALEN